MTLTELKYIVAVARERHFGRAAKACFISQPTLSVAVKKLEDELEVKIFERRASEVSLTPLGADIVRQAQSVLEGAEAIRATARAARDPLSGALRLGVIYTIGPYLLPALVQANIARTPQMPLMLHENFTVRLLEMLHAGEIDCAILAEPFPMQALAAAPLYDEPFVAVLPAAHPLAHEASISSAQLREETMLILGAGHCFRDHVLQVCPEFARYASRTEGISRSFEGSSLATIVHMVAAGLGVTLAPRLAMPEGGQDAAGLLRYVPLRADDDGHSAPTRRVVLCWRRSFTRVQAIAALRRALGDCALPGVQRVQEVVQRV